MKEKNMEQKNVTQKKQMIPPGVLGTLLLILSFGISAYAAVRSAKTEGIAAPLAVVVGVYAVVLILRVLFIKLSARILGIASSWGRAMFLVGANAALLSVLTLLMGALGLVSSLATLIVFALSIVCAFIFARKTLGASFAEALSLYALSVAMAITALVVLLVVFHFSFKMLPFAGLR